MSHLQELLVVEDDTAGLSILSVVLRRLGIRIVMERYAASAVEMAKKMSRVDIVFSDLGPPDDDGYEVLTELKSEATFKQVPIIAVTARDPGTEMDKARATGFGGFLGKTLNRNRFSDQVQRIIAGEGVWEVYQ